MVINTFMSKTSPSVTFVSILLNNLKKEKTYQRSLYFKSYVIFQNVFPFIGADITFWWVNFLLK